MTFYQPTRPRYEMEPQLLVLIISVFLLLISFLMVSFFTPHVHRDRILPDSTLAWKDTTAKTHTPVITAVVKANTIDAALNQLLKGTRQQTSGHFSEIPSGTQLLGVMVQNNVVTVNLSREFASGGGSTSLLGRVAELQKVITAINPSYHLKIAINGKLVEYLGGEGLEVNQ